MSAYVGVSRRHCGLDPQSRGEAAGTRHAEYLLDTTVAQARTGFKAVSTGWCDNQTNQPYSPSPLMGEETKACPSA